MGADLHGTTRSVNRVQPVGDRLLMYVSHGRTTHDDRFIAAATSAGWRVAHVLLEGPAADGTASPYPDGCRAVEWKSPTRDGAFDVDAAEAEFRALVLRLRPSLIHAGPLHTASWLAVRCADVPVVAMSWAWDILVEAEAHPGSRERIVEALSGADSLIVDAAHLADICREWGAAASGILVVPWGIDLEDFPLIPPPTREADDEVRILSMRAFEPIYSVETLIRAMARLRNTPGDLPNWTATMVGDGSQRPDLEALARAEGIMSNLRWTGRLPERALAAEIAASDLCVSTALSDGTSISMLQAMAIGRPCIVADLPTNREWVQEPATGWLFEPGSPESLADAIMRATRARRSWPEVTASARAMVEHRADWSKNQSAVIALYDAALRT